MSDPTGATPMNSADRDRIERDLAALIAVPSITGDEFAVQDMVADVLAAVATRSLHVRIGQTFPLAEAAAAHASIEGRGVVGRVVLIP